jgi:hypothetical protein
MLKKVSSLREIDFFFSLRFASHHYTTTLTMFRSVRGLHPHLLCGNMYDLSFRRLLSSTPPKQFMKKKQKNLFLTAGLPLMLLVVAGSVLISNFLQTQVELKGFSHKTSSPRQFDLEEEHRKLTKQLDIDNYTLSKIPKPEELLDEEEQEKRKKAAKEKKKKQKKEDSHIEDANTKQ